MTKRVASQFRRQRYYIFRVRGIPSATKCIPAKIRGIKGLISDDFEDTLPYRMIKPMNPSQLSWKGAIVQFPTQFSAYNPRQFGLWTPWLIRPMPMGNGQNRWWITCVILDGYIAIRVPPHSCALLICLPRRTLFIFLHVTVNFVLNNPRPFPDVSTIHKINCFRFTFADKRVQKEKPSFLRASPVNWHLT